MLKLSRFLGLLGPLGSIDPENKDSFDNFNASLVLSVFFSNVKVLLRFGRHFPEKVSETAGKLNHAKKTRKTREMLKVSKVSKISGSTGLIQPNRPENL